MPALLPSASMRVLVADADNVFASEGRLLVQVRRGTMTLTTLERVESFVTGATAGTEPLGMITIFEETAVVPEADVRKRQNEVLKRALSRPSVHVALVVLAGGVKGTMLRTISRTMSLGIARVSTFASVDDASRWIAPLVGMSTTAVTQLTEQTRTRGTK